MISVGQCLLALMLSSFSTGVSSLQCYRCLVRPQNDNSSSSANICTYFDHSKKFIVECPYSTMCMKQEFRHIIGGETVNSIYRDCAPQLNTDLQYENGEWVKSMTVMDPYEEGCHIIDDKGERTNSFNRFCYCRGNLCNSSPTTNHEGYTDIMGVIVVFNLMKYINSLR